MHTDQNKGPQSLFILTSVSVNKEPKLTLPLVHEKYYSQLYHKGQSCDQFYSIFLSAIYFSKPQKILILLAGYANDNLPYTYSSKIEDVLTNLQGASEKLFEWFSANHLLVNSGKCHLLTSFNLPVDIRITNTKVFNEERVKFLGVNFRSRRNLKGKSNVPLSCQNMQ